MSLEDAYLDARPDQDEMEDAINQFLVQLEKQEKKGFKDMGLTRSRPVFFQHWIKIGPICSLRRSFACTDTLRTTGKTGISRDIPG